MQNNIVRAFVLTLAFVGFSATVASARSTANVIPTVNAPANNGGPVPLCVPSDPTYCGMH